jgi:hypothetical protein
MEKLRKIKANFGRYNRNCKSDFKNMSQERIRAGEKSTAGPAQTEVNISQKTTERIATYENATESIISRKNTVL